MSLEENNLSRDYLYGRLLAVAENIEHYFLTKEEKLRPTKAERYMQRFAIQPYTTWLYIYARLRPYINRLKSSLEHRGFIFSREKELEDIHSLFTSDSYNDNSKLSPEYLLGYFTQKRKLFNKKEGE